MPNSYYKDETLDEDSPGSRSQDLVCEINMKSVERSVCTVY